MKKIKKGISKKSLILIIVQSIISLVLIIFSILLSINLVDEFSLRKRLVTDTRESIKYNSENVYYIDFMGLDLVDNNDYMQFLKELREIPQIVSSGTFDSTATYYSELMKDSKYNKIHKKIISEKKFGYMDEFDGTEVIRMTDSIYDMCDINVESGQSYEEYNGEEIPILVGYRYKNVVEVGQILTDVYYKKKYKVIGIMKENSRWIIDNDISKMDYVLETNINLDNYFVEVYKYDDLINKETEDTKENEQQVAKLRLDFNSTYICLEKGNDKEKILSQVEEIKEKNNLEFEIKNMEEKYIEINGEHGEEIAFDLRKEITVTGILCVLSIVSLIILIKTLLVKKKKISDVN